MSANFKKVWSVVCTSCGDDAPLVDGDAKKHEVETLLAMHGWRFPFHEPVCPKCGPKEVAS